MHGENEPSPDPWHDLANCVLLAFLGLCDCLARRGPRSSKCGLPLGAHPTNAESGGSGHRKDSITGTVAMSRQPAELRASECRPSN